MFRNAVVCKHCRRDVDPLPDIPTISDVQAAAIYKNNKWLVLGGPFTLLGIFAASIWWTGLNNPTIPGYLRIGAITIAIAFHSLGVFSIIKGNIQVGKDNPDLYPEKSK